MRLKNLLLFLFFATLFTDTPLWAFGKNKIQYKNFEWYYIQSKRFDIYYYPGGEELAEFTAEVAEDAYEQLMRDFSYEIKERIVIIIYKSHNDWQQTNVVLSYLTEGIGGVTELYKNRIVVPFEGSYEQFRHVIHHELVHGVMNDMLYGGSIQSLVMGEVIPVPLWVSEGLAEFQSTGWNTRTDMIVRDATLNGYIPPIQYLEYILAYQGGNAVFRYIAETYGRQKIGELLHKSRGKVSFNQVMKSSVGLDYEGFTERWHHYLRKEYWPEVTNRKIPREMSREMTDHEKQNNFLNVSPTISPQGDKIAYIADRKGYQNIYLMSAIDGKEIKTLVKGQRSESFEELHFLRPGMSFSPDGKRIAFAAKSGPWDAIYTVDINNGDTEKYLMKMDGAFTTSWSPDGDRIAFVGNKDGYSDIYIFNLKSQEIKAVTNDVFTDDQPSWSADGRNLVFVSDRGGYLSNEDLPPDFKMSEYDYEFRDIYTVDLETGELTRRTNTPWEEGSPIFTPDGKKIAFVSDQNGIFNLYFQSLENGDYYPVTNIISGILQINWDQNANKLVYSTFYKGGFDIYLINNPLDLKELELNRTKFASERYGLKLPVYAREWESEKDTTRNVPELAQKEKTVLGENPTDYSRYVFGRYRQREKRKKPEEVEIPEEKFKTASGEYKSRKYKLKFSPDFVTGTAGYNTFFGLQGYTSFAFSDLLGDHKIFLNTNLWADLRNSDFLLMYYYLKQRLNLGFGGYHLVYLFSSSRGLIRYRNFGTALSASYPFNRFDRVDLNLLWYNVYLEYLDVSIPTQKISTFLPEISYVHDNVLWGLQWGIPAPVNGSRYGILLRISPKYNNNSLDFQTFKFDYRKYFMLSTKYQFAARGTAGISRGQNAQQFFLGGVENWINRDFGEEGKRINNIDDVFFSEFITPLRGAAYYERVGDRFFLTNWELRFPLIEYLKLGIPPISLFNIRGVAFYDIGTSWENTSDDWWSMKDFRAFRKDENGNTVFDDLISGYGIGSRIFFLGFLVKFDIAWPFNWHKSSEPVYYWSLGLDF